MSPKKKPGNSINCSGLKSVNPMKENMTSMILNTNAVLTMTSREIAVLTGKQHGHVRRDIENMLEELGLLTDGCIQFWTDPQNGKTYPEYALDRELTETLLTGYSAVLRRKVIARWHELEARPSHNIPTTLSAALRLAADQSDQIEAQQAQLAIAAPKVAFVDAYVESTGLKGFRQVAKLLKANESRLREFLEGKIMYMLGGEWHAYQHHIDAGRFSVKTGTNAVNQHSFSRSLFTPKGVEWLAGLWAVHCLNGAAK